jgi:PD-(D/E)XK nuclease superfamily
MTLLETIATVEAETTALRNGAFSEAMPTLQVYFDSTSLGVLKECPRKYYYRIIKGLVPAHGVLNDHLRFGILVHRAFELYDKFRARGADPQEAEIAVLRDAALATWDWDIGRPWASNVGEKNRETLFRTIVWYLAQFGEADPAETIVLADSKPAVELHFTFDLGDGYRSRLTGETFHLCGHIDRLVRWRSRVWVTDRKTTKNQLTPAFFAQFSPDNQMSVYDLAGTMIYPEPCAGIIIDAIQVGATFSRFQRGFVERTPSQVEEFLHDLHYYLSCAESFAEANYWPMNDKACGHVGWDEERGTLRFGCEFREICGSDPAVRETKLAAQFERSTWDPTQLR